MRYDLALNWVSHMIARHDMGLEKHWTEYIMSKSHDEAIGVPYACSKHGSIQKIS